MTGQAPLIDGGMVYRRRQEIISGIWAHVSWMLEAVILLQLGLGDYAEAGVVALLLPMPPTTRQPCVNHKWVCGIRLKLLNEMERLRTE